MIELKQISLSIVDDNLEMAILLKELLGQYDALKRIDLFSCAEDFIEASKSFKSDVVLMDLQLPGISGQQCIEIVKSKNPTMQFIVFTVFGDDDNVFRALRSGATGYLVKSENYQNIWDAIQLVACGGSPMTPSISRMVIAYFSTLKSNETVQKLTKRECEILELLAQGKRYKEIAEELFISMDTVRTHIRNIYIKLEVDNKTSAINKYKS